MNSLSAEARETYREGVAALISGDAAAAIRRLEPLAEEDAPFEVRLALGKAYLATHQGAEALVPLEALLAETGEEADPGLRAYLGLLVAAAETLSGAREAALARLEGIPALDPRMEYAARQLHRRIENSRPPLIRF